LGNPQPILLVFLSEIGSSMDKIKLENKFSEELSKINSKLEPYKKISTIVLVNEPWTVENGLVTPTLKVKRPMIDKRYSKNYQKWHANSSKIVWE